MSIMANVYLDNRPVGHVSNASSATPHSFLSGFMTYRRGVRAHKLISYTVDSIFERATLTLTSIPKTPFSKEKGKRRFWQYFYEQNVVPWGNHLVLLSKQPMKEKKSIDIRKQVSLTMVL